MSTNDRAKFVDYIDVLPGTNNPTNERRAQLKEIGERTKNTLSRLPREFVEKLGLDKPFTNPDGARIYPHKDGHDSVMTDYEQQPCDMCGGRVRRAVRFRNNFMQENVSTLYHHCTRAIPMMLGSVNDKDHEEHVERFVFYTSKNREAQAGHLWFDWSIVLQDIGSSNTANPHDGCLDCNGSGWAGGVIGSPCDVPRLK